MWKFNLLILLVAATHPLPSSSFGTHCLFPGSEKELGNYFTDSLIRRCNRDCFTHEQSYKIPSHCMFCWFIKSRNLFTSSTGKTTEIVKLSGLDDELGNYYNRTMIPKCKRECETSRSEIPFYCFQCFDLFNKQIGCTNPPTNSTGTNENTTTENEQNFT